MGGKRAGGKGLYALGSIACGLLSLLVVFGVVPALPPCPDPVWMAADVIVPVALALLLPGAALQAPPLYIWLGLPVQYLVLALFPAAVSRHLGMSLGGLGGFEYLFAALVWPLMVTLAQFLALLLFQKVVRFRTRS